MLTCMVLLGISACGEDDLSTNQYSGGVSLNVFGPSPVVRGGTLRFMGSNLDQVVEVQIPGVSAITDIEVVKSGIPSEIRVQVPKDGPEVGYVTLVTSDGKTLTTESELTYEESIEFTSFSPASVMPGDVLTIEGDYLNLIQEVIFADNVIVKAEDFLSQDRYKITVTVPDEACTGDVILSDGDSEATDASANLIYSEDELVVGTPTIESFSAARFKAGETLTITGTYLYLVNYIEFEGIDVPSASLAEEGEDSFTVNDEGTQITLTQPADAATGEVKFLLSSGVEVTVATEEEFQVVVPSGLAIASEMVKAGLALTITGADLDLVTSVTFPTDVDGGEFTVEGTTLEVAAIPATATDGDITLNMQNGMSATVSYTLVKPVVTGYSSSSASAGGTVTLTGTDLDLVTSVSFGGGSEATPDESTETSLTVTVPMDSSTGVVVLTLANGTTVEAPELTVEEAVFCYITELPDTETTEIMAGDLLSVPVANGDVLTSVEVNGTTVQYVLTGSTLHIGIPETAGADTSIRLVSSNGEITYTIDVTPANEVTTTIWTGVGNVGSWGSMGDLSWGGYDWSTVTAGTILTVYFTEDTSYDYWQIRFGNGSWSALPGTGDISLEAGATSYSLTLTQEMIDELVNSGGLVMTGCNYIISKITLTVITETATTVWSGSYAISNWNAFQDLSWGGYDWSVLQAGMKLTMYFTLDSSSTYWQIRVAKGNGWTALAGTSDQYDLTSDATEFSVTLTDAMVDELINDGGLILTGHGYTLTKITYE